MSTRRAIGIPILLEPPVYAPPPAAAPLARYAHWLHGHRGLIAAIQWAVIAVYLVLVITPAWLPLPPESARIHDNLVRFAQFLFWGIWWPFVILSMVLVGRVWCGVFCPEGALSERVSLHSRNWKPVPDWVRWPGWPFLGFVGTTVYGQMLSIYDYAKPALLILGGSTAAAMVLAYFYGRERRLWCRYLCPVNGVFHLLARLAPVQLVIDAAQWQQGRDRHEVAPTCAPLVNIRHLQSSADCHQCFRCHGYRGAVQLRWRAPSAEILDGRGTLTGWHHALIGYGIFGLAGTAFQWTSSPWFLQLKLWLVGIVADRGWWWALQDVPHWVLFTYYPEANDVFNWVDGAALLSYLTLGTLIIGGWMHACLRAAAALLPGLHWQRLNETLTPLAGATLFLGLSMTTVSLLRADGYSLPLVNEVRALLLAGGLLWSGAQFWRMSRPLSALRRVLAGLLWLLALLPALTIWVLLFWVW